jgi:hypothetical protein
MRLPYLNLRRPYCVRGLGAGGSTAMGIFSGQARSSLGAGTAVSFGVSAVVLQRLALIADHPRDDQIASHQAAIWNSSAMKSA